MPGLESAVAKMFWVGFHGTTPSEDLLRLLDRGVGGVVLFARNIESPQQASAMIAQMKEKAGRPLALAIDHEGGRVMRVKSPFTQTPPMRVLGKVGDAALVRDVGRVFAKELRAIGFDMDFAPVLDVDTNAANPVIAARSFGDNPALVAEMGMALADGLQAEGLAACAKHFPGHGDTSEDSHTDLPRIKHNDERLRRIELAPFKKACVADIAGVMVSHVIYEAWDSAVPATMSEPIIGGLLRREMGYNGLVISDDMEMKAIATHYGVNRAVVAAAGAGMDIMLCCHSAQVMHDAIDTLIDAAKRDKTLADKIAQANLRIDTFNQRYTRPAEASADLSVFGCDEHKRLTERLAACPEAADYYDIMPDPTDTRRWRGE